MKRGPWLKIWVEVNDGAGVCLQGSVITAISLCLQDRSRRLLLKPHMLIFQKVSLGEQKNITLFLINLTNIHFLRWLQTVYMG